MTALQSGALNLGIAADTMAGAFVAKLSARTTDQAIDDAEKLLGTLTPGKNRRARGAGYGGGGGQDGGNHGGS